VYKRQDIPGVVAEQAFQLRERGALMHPNAGKVRLTVGCARRRGGEVGLSLIHI